MHRSNELWSGEMKTEAQAIVDLVDANVSPIAAAGAWEAEIAARQHGERDEPSPPVNEELQAVIEISSVLA
jgi:hypothetical protein